MKRSGYAGYGVQEYWRFDHTGGRFHDAPIAGDTLVDGKYERLQIHDDDGLLWGHSAVLGLDLCWDDGQLRFRDPTTGEFLPTIEEVDGARSTAEFERNVAEFERISAEAERDAAEARANSAEAEAAQLREQLRRLQEG